MTEKYSVILSERIGERTDDSIDRDCRPLLRAGWELRSACVILEVREILVLYQRVQGRDQEDIGGLVTSCSGITHLIPSLTMEKVQAIEKERGVEEEKTVNPSFQHRRSADVAT